jgi:hypothetical protein
MTQSGGHPDNLKIDKISLKDKLNECVAYSTLHGIPHLFKKTFFGIKLVWSICLIISWSTCAYFIIRSLLQYFEFKVNVNVELISERPTHFPSVDICNLTPYDGDAIHVSKLNFTLDSSHPDLEMSYSHEDENVDNLKNYLREFAQNKLIREEKYDQMNRRNNDKYHNILMTKNTKILAGNIIRHKLNEFENEASRGLLNLTAIGFQLNRMLISCKFQGMLCSPADFTMYHNYYYGNCYRFNGGVDSDNKKVEIKKSTKPGWRFGLQLELFTGKNGILSLKSGFRILVHNQSDTVAFPEEDGIFFHLPSYFLI